MFRLLSIVLMAMLALPVAAETNRRLPQSAAEVHLSYAPLVKQTAPAVVNIYTKKVMKERRFSTLFDDPFFRRFLGDDWPGGQRKRVQNSLGSGVIVAADGLIVTNHHVVEGADEVRVVLSDRREYSARIVAMQERNDLALLQVDSEGDTLPKLSFGDSNEIEVGDLILAIGNPFGVGQTVTSGIVSATARSTKAIGDGGVFIQIDAAINPGNSGGALVDMAGRLVGVNTAIFSRSGGSHGIGFAIPANLVQQIVLAHQRGGKAFRPWLGAAGETVNQEIASALGMVRPRGVILSGVRADGPLYLAGLRENDIILSVGGQAVDDMVALRFRLETTFGSEAGLTYWRKGKQRRADVAIVPPPEIPPRNETILSAASPFQGLRVINVSPAVIEELKLRGVDDGVVVTGVRRGSTARRLGFRKGDVIQQINGQDIALIKELRLWEGRDPSVWQIYLRRKGKRLKMEFRG